MLFKCRNIGSRIYTLIKKINIQNVSVIHFNGSSKSAYELIHNRNFCTSKQDDNAEVVNYALITNGDEELERKLKILELELEVMRQEGLMVPPTSFISTEHWKELLSLPSRSARLKFYKFLFLNKMKKENEKKKKIDKAKKWAEEEREVVNSRDLPIEEFAQRYGLGYNNVLLRIFDTTINNFYNNRLIQAIRFGEKLVIDCSYEQNMNRRENMNCAKQLMLLFAENRLHDDPFDLYLCNVDKQGPLMQNVYRFIPTVYEPWFPLNIHEESYLDIFSKEQLVYLTPHCKEEMKTYDPDAVYIVGGLVDKSNNEPLSLAKAKKEGLKMAKLPLDRHLHWGLGDKSLTLNQMTSILLDIKTTGNWQHALRHVPRRKLVLDTPVSKLYENIEKATNSLRFDRPERSKSNRWSPSNSEFVKFQHGKKNDTNRQRLINLNQFINE